MKKNILLLFFFIILITGINSRLSSQTHTITHNVDWVTHDQNMWGPNGSPFTLNMDIELFNISFGDTNSFGGIEDLGWLGQWGAVVDIGTWLEAASVFSIHGFTTGSVDAEYPVSIDLTFPDNYTFNPGEWITINTDYNVEPGWDLTTHFPTAGIIQLDFFFGFGLDISATVCLYDCFTLDIISLNLPTDSINIFYLNSQTGEVSYPCWNGFFFSICHDDILPIIIQDWWDIGLTGFIDIPYVVTHDWLGADDCLYAHGNDLWLHLNVDIIQLLSAIAQLIPPPAGPIISQILGYMSGTFDLGGGITIDYTLLSLNFGLDSYMTQDFTLCPDVWTRFSFPTTVPYNISDPGNADSIVEAGVSDTCDVLCGYDLNFKYPCDGYPVWDIGIQHYLTNDFTNHTWDSMAFYFNISAFEFWINLPFKSMTEFSIPEYCIEFPVPCMEKSNGPDTCWDTICNPPIIIPPISQQPDLTIHIGPLINMTWPLGYIPITWYNNTWQLGGWLPNQTGIYDTIMAPEQLIPNPPMTMHAEITTQIICYGDSTGAITAFVENGTPPYTYIWSTGDSTTTNNTTNSITNLGAGTYYVTVYDQGPCYFYDTVDISNIDPQMFISLEVKNVTCISGSDGQITAHVTGGTPGYTYVWSPFGGYDSIASNLPAGTYSVVATDLLNCQISDTATLIELWPLPEIGMRAEPDSGCQPLRVQFYETTIDSGQSYLWDYHDNGATDTVKNPIHTFLNSGDYDITIYVTSNHGCLDSMTIEDMITVFPKPNANFEPEPTVTDILESWVAFNNLSDNTFWSYWALGDGEYSHETEPLHHYVDTGYFHIVLYIQTEHGCRDTTSKDIYVKESITFYAPNAFTPDRDGNNEEFLVKGTGILNSTFNMIIYDRWGKQVFQSNDVEKGWNGKINETTVADPAVYTWVVTYRDIDRKYHKYTGSLVLLR